MERTAESTMATSLPNGNGTRTGANDDAPFLSRLVDKASKALENAKEIDDAKALVSKFCVMGVMALVYVLAQSCVVFYNANPARFSRDDPVCETLKKATRAPVYFVGIYYRLGAVLFAGMCGECFSIPGDLLTSLLNDAFSIILGKRRHSFLGEYMVFLTVSGFHVWMCIRLLGCPLNVLSGEVCDSLIARSRCTVTEQERRAVMSGESAYSIINVYDSVGPGRDFLPSRTEAVTYCLLVAKMMLFSLFARAVAFSILWVTILFLPLVAEPVFVASDLVFGLTFEWGGQVGVSFLAVAWSVFVGIFLGDEQSKAGEGKEVPVKSPLEPFYLAAYLKTALPLSTFLGRAASTTPRSRPGARSTPLL